ncbi:unnamed protein product [Diatraea saccharalis]|uniref:dihydrofolate reductase n=1 Tax=Diatraea saccharalis TaxID=40085 RepID=A0A9P0G0P4_9NEOP|nr:unnamed protein product [Diatraea saccharalis]
MAYFTSMTTQIKDPTKVNAVIMGRNTWDCIPPKYRPLSGRVNVVLTHQVNEIQKKVPEGVVVVGSLQEAIQYIENREDIESTWVIGGSSIYKAALSHPNCGKIYLTEIQKDFECDTFFPSLDKEQFKMVKEDGIPDDLQWEGDISYYFRIYQKI